MYLSKVKICDFRLFQNLEVVLSPDLNVIVGENNSGKTALIDSIRYTLDTNSSEWIKVHESDFRKGQTRFTINLRFDKITPQQASVFVEHLTHEELPAGGRQSVLYVNLIAELTDQIHRGTRTIRTELRSGANAEGLLVDREIRRYLSATYLRPLRDAEAELTATRGSRLSQVLHASESFRDLANVNALLEALIEANRQIIGNPGIADSRTRIGEQLRHLNFKNSPLSPIIEILGGRDIANLSVPERAQMFRSALERLQLLIDENNRYQGLGYSNLLFMAAELLLLKQEQDEFPLLLIEEPEAHLHPQLQMKFLNALVNDFSGPGKPALQSILTTHSPNLASKSPLENIIIMSGGKAFPLRAGDTELAPTDYEFLEKFLDVTKANLFFARAVVIVEGDGENILMPTIARLVGRPLENYAVSVVNVGNTAFARYANIFRRKDKNDAAHRDAWLPTKVVCLRDIDRWPARAEQRDDDDTIGFKERKPPKNGRGGNLANWENTDDQLAARRLSLKNVGGQNVSVEVSDHWTFEYSLICAGLAKQVHLATGGTDATFLLLSANAEERAIQIYQDIETTSGAKTKTAYELVRILKSEFEPVFEERMGESTEQREHRQVAHMGLVEARQADLRRKLPTYLLNAIEFVTEPLPHLEAEQPAEAAQHA